MSPEDARHGTTAGYNAGCRDLCCRRAAADYERKRVARVYINRGSLLEDGTGTRRRLQALMCLGWSAHALDQQLGRKRSYTAWLIKREAPVNQATARDVAELYDRLSMTLPPETNGMERASATKARRHAQAMGYVPPLAWDDIDRDPEPVTQCDQDDAIDPVVVMRLLEGRRVKSSRAEREQAIRRWVADGGTKTEFCNIHGWAPERYQVGLRLVGEAS